MNYEYWGYIIASASGTLYIGVTNNLEVRVGQHKSGEIDGFAKKYHCSRLVYYEKFENIFKAIAREKQLKGWRRSKKVALIEKMNPRWEDLAEKWGEKMLFSGEKMGRNSRENSLRPLLRNKYSRGPSTRAFALAQDDTV